MHFRDDFGKKPFVRDFRDINCHLQDFDSQGDANLPFQFDMRITEPNSTLIGAVDISGEVGLAPLRLRADINADKVQLAGLESYFPPDFAGILA